MINPRNWFELIGTTAIAPHAGQGSAGAVALYVSVGPALTQYDVDVDGAALVKRGAVTLPANMQYAWPHTSRRYFYIVSSNGGPRLAGDKHWLSAYRIDANSGALVPHGDPVALPSRPIHLTLDAQSRHALVAYNIPSGVTIHRINADGTLGEEVKQDAPSDTGIFAHQILMSRSGKFAVLVTRGNDAAGGKPEDPGALKVFRYRDGQLSDCISVRSGGGYGYGPRHLDFHPSQPWVYVSMERQNKLYAYAVQGDALSADPLYMKNNLANQRNHRAGQLAGAIHIHPGGRFVYVSNRASSTVEFEGKPVFGGGENNIAAYAIDPKNGEPTLIQHADTRGLHPRTFAIDPSGRLLVVANLVPLAVRDGSAINTVPACLSVFRIGADGRLDYARKYDIDVGGDMMFWAGMVQR